MGPFNNREIASAGWLIVFVVWAMTKADVRREAVSLLKAFFQYKILIPICVMGVYATGSVFLLASVSLWDATHLKDTIVWFCAGALAMMVRVITSTTSDRIFRTIVVENIAIVVVLEFLANTYTFSLPAEIVLIPSVTVVLLTNLVANSDKRYAAVSKLTKGLQTIIGLIVLAIVLRRAISDIRNLQSLDTLRSILLAPLLSVLLCPFLYVIALVSKYEQVFMRLDLGTNKAPKLKRYARRRIILHVGLSMKRVLHILEHHIIDILQIETGSDVDNLLKPHKKC